MSLHYGFSDSEHDDVDSGPYECSDLGNCENGVDCKGEHNYSAEYIRLKGGEDTLSESVNKSEKTVDKPLETVIQVSVMVSSDWLLKTNPVIRDRGSTSFFNDLSIETRRRNGWPNQRRW